jgi:NADPH:quinone reductase-like Zn-dependent oxidoreductase
VGSTLIQICKLAGYSPIVSVVGSTHKVNICKRLGATIVIDKSKLSGQSSLNDKIMEASDHLGYIAIFDANGVETIQQSYDQLTQCGRLVIYGFHRYSSAYCNQIHRIVHAGD